MRQHLKFLITAVILIIGLIYLYINREHLTVLYNITLKDIILIYFFTFLYFCLCGYTFNLIVNLLDIKLTKTEIIGLTILTNFGNYLGPTRPGSAIKAIYLKNTKKLGYSQFLSVLAANTFLVFFITGVFGILLLFLLDSTNNKIMIPIQLYFVCLVLIVVSVIPFIINLKSIKAKGRIAKFFQSSLKGFSIIKFQKYKIFFISLTIICQFCLCAIINKLTYNSIGVNITFISALIIGVFASMANIFTITPSNLGIQESVIAYLFNITGFDFTSGILGASVARIVHISITFLLAPIFFYILLKPINLHIFEKK